MGAIGARLHRYARVWTEQVKESWVIDVVQAGHRCKFLFLPKTLHFSPTQLPHNQQRAWIIFEYIQMLLQKGAIEPVPVQEQMQGFYSPLFLVQKKTGDLRPVLDLRDLNKLISVQSFKMESLQSIAQALSKGNWMLSLDLKDAYLHVPVNPQFHKYLRFAVSNQHYQFVCLLFGLSTSPRTFSKVVLPIIAILRRQGLQVFHYLDDILLMAESPQILLNHRQILIEKLQEFGWIINWRKSQLQPS